MHDVDTNAPSPHNSLNYTLGLNGSPTKDSSGYGDVYTINLGASVGAGQDATVAHYLDTESATIHF